MKIRHLVLRNNEANHVEVIRYPDGQQTVKIDLDYYAVKNPIKISCSIRNWAELEVLICIVEALYKNDRFVHAIEFVYLFGMRSDRAFSAGEPNYFKDVIAPILNRLKKYQTNEPFFKMFVPHSALSSLSIDFSYFDTSRIQMCSHPDFSKSIKLGGDESCELYDLPCFQKERTADGIKVELSQKISEAFAKELEKNPDHQVLIMDDLCDGGATFIAEAKYLREHFPQIKRLALFVFHGLFTKGVDHVLEHFDFIYTTNSYQEVVHPKVLTIDVFGDKTKNDS